MHYLRQMVIRRVTVELLEKAEIVPEIGAKNVTEIVVESPSKILLETSS